MEVPPLRSSVVAALAIVALGAGLWWQSHAPEALPSAPITAPTVSTARSITVHVAGAVQAPGLVQVPAGSRVADVIATAGGARRDADLTALNLAADVADGSHLVVPLQGEASRADGATAGPVRVNTASAVDLQRVPGVGPVLAERIIAHRDANGPFSAIEDLLDVPGIGEGKLAAMRDSVTVP